MERSADKKLGNASATYASIKFTCPSSCAFYPTEHPTNDNRKPGTRFTCYALSGNVRTHVTRLNSGDAEDAVAAAQQEAEAIGRLSGRHPLRLHVSGDCLSPEAARIIARACADYTAKHGQPVWTYSHNHAAIPGDEWGVINVRASVQSADDAERAIANGYRALALAYTTPDGKPLTKAFTFGGRRYTPCPEMNGRSPNCTKCGLCLKTNVNVAFIGHAGARNGKTEHGNLPTITS